MHVNKSMYKCICICIAFPHVYHIYAHRLSICIYICVFIHIHIYVCIFRHIHTYVCVWFTDGSLSICKCNYVRPFKAFGTIRYEKLRRLNEQRSKQASWYIRIYLYLCVSINLQRSTHTHTYARMYDICVYMCVCVYVCIHVYSSIKIT